MIHIAFNCDENYKKYLSVVIKSIKLNTKSPITFHVIGLDEFEGCNCYPAPDISILECKKQFGHINESAFYRLFIPEVIKVDKVIYLDIDLIVLTDIKDLWEIPCRYLSACKDPLNDMQLTKLGLNKPYYINSGVLLMNTKAIREDKDYLQRVIKASRNPRLSLLDQDIFNEACEIDLLPPEWNTYSKDYGQKYIENPKIIHCCGHNKFWNSNIRGTEEFNKINFQ